MRLEINTNLIFFAYFENNRVIFIKERLAKKGNMF